MIRSHGGGCQCGTVRFVASGEPKFTARCHCASCRHATGAEYTTWVGWRDDQVIWNNHQPTLYASSTDVLRGFCDKCGTPVSYRSEKWPGETHLLIGLFDQPQDFLPQGDVFRGEALPWVSGEITKP